MSRWVIEREDCSVHKDQRVVRRPDTLADAVRYVQKQFQPKDRVVVRDEDGYTTNFTRYFERGTATRLNL
jgi:hypothetical protein